VTREVIKLETALAELTTATLWENLGVVLGSPVVLAIVMAVAGLNLASRIARKVKAISR